jgi:hypothetical protein
MAVLLYLPATLANSASTALLTAGAINVVVVIAPIFAVCLLWPVGGTNLSNELRILAGLLCIVAWPSSSFQFIQADNAAVAYGLISNLLLMRAYAAGHRPGWLAACAAVAALASKQMSAGLIIAQVCWLVWASGWRTAAGYAARSAIAGSAFGLAAVSVFGFDGLWLNMVDLPNRIPWTTEHGRRLWDLAPVLLLHLGLPLLGLGVCLIWRRGLLRHGSPLMLPALTWIATLPLGFAALFKLGGSINSLHGFAYFLPPAVLVLFSTTEFAKSGLTWRIWPMVTICLVLLRVDFFAAAIWQPRIAHLIQASNLATQLKGQIWFPWNPLVTYYSDGQFYHVEDGLFVRFIAGKPLTMAEGRAFLPRQWRALALWPGGLDYGIAVHLCPTANKITETPYWTIRSW